MTERRRSGRAWARWAWYPAFTLALLTTGAVRAQDAGTAEPAAATEPDTTAEPAAATEPVTTPAPAARAQGSTRPGDLPDPAQWELDEEERHTAWLNRPLIDPADLAARPGAYADVLASHGILLDLDSRLLALRGATLHEGGAMGYPVEYLVVTSRGRTYEAAVIVRAMPSVVDACLQAMGLEPGSPTRFSERDPPPTDAELEAGISAWIMHSAGGPLMTIDVQWTDGDGLPHSASLESMLVELPFDGSEPRPLEQLGWVYCGSGFGSFRQGREMVRWHRGDVEGDLVAIYLDGRQACLLERNSPDGIDGSLYTLNPETVPGPNTPVTLMIRPRDDEVMRSHEVSLDRSPDALAGDPSAR